MPAHVVICGRAQIALLECDVAGRSIRGHLSDGLRDAFGDHPVVAAATALREFPRDEGLLIVDSRAWFPLAPTAPAWSQPAAGSHTFRVVNERSETLAVY